MERGLSSCENITVVEKLSMNFKEVEWQKRDQVTSMTSGEAQNDPGKKYCIVIECSQRPGWYKFSSKELVLRNGQIFKSGAQREYQ